MGTIASKVPLFGGVLLSTIGVSLALSVSATASPPDFLLRMPQGDGVPGSGAAKMNNPRGVAGNPATGHVYVSDLNNERINKYTAWGLFVKAWGWDVAPEGAPGDTPTDGLETCGPAVPEAVPAPGLCKGGVAGTSSGQLNQPLGLAVDPGGNVYVYERGNRRVQKFSGDGGFVVMFGGDVNKTKVEEGAAPTQRNRCPVDPADVCQAGASGEGPSQLETAIGDFVAYSPSEGGTILVGDKGGIQVFDTSGNHLKTIAFEGPLAALAGKQVNGLDVDNDANIFITLDATEDVYKLSPTGEPVSPGNPGASSFDAEEPLGVAVDVEGSVYAIDDPEGFAGAPPHVLEYSSSGVRLMPTAAEEGSGQLFPERPPAARLTAIATNICAGSEEPGNLYVGFFNAGEVSYVDAYGTAPIGCETPPLVPPAIGEQFATFVGREEATVRALINPRFWPDTTYYVEYGPGECSTGGCPNQAPIPPALLTKRSVNTFFPAAGVILEGLAPATTYHYRFVVQSSGGGPVHGSDPDGAGPLAADEEHGVEASFRTHAAKGARPTCPNSAFRIGPAGDLPDCRAYEMVSPLDKGNADVALGIARNNEPYQLYEVNKAAIAGDRFTYTAATAFGDAESAPFSSQYLAERGPLGWGNEGISAPRTEAGVTITLNFGAEFHGFTDDLCRGWLRVLSVAPLVPEAVVKYPNLYRRENCAEPPGFSAITTEKPPTRSPENYFRLLVEGFSVDGDRTIFTAPDKLHPDAPVPVASEKLLYESGPEGVRFVCYLPNGEPISEGCAAGTASVTGSVSAHNAMSADGSRIFWTAYTHASGASSDPGRIFVRIDGTETLAVSGAVSSDPAFFLTAAENGSKAIFSFVHGTHSGELYEFDVDAETATPIAKGVEGQMGASEDASRIYFASTEDLDDTGPATAGAHNLYFYEADAGGGTGSFQFIMRLAPEDLSDSGSIGSDPLLRPVAFQPVLRAARVTPDGLHATFVSAASPTPTGYDNRDADTGKAAAEVYRYDAAAKQLRCVSCNLTGARPAGGSSGGVLSAARIQGWEINNHAPRVISDDGSRVFFESHEALVPDDANGTWDVYQWEEPGTGTCTTSSPTFGEKSGGCVDLISSGKSPARSLFLDADPSGDNIFFSTQSSLVSQDYGLNDVYVARVGGGFPPPPKKGDCEGGACQSPPPPPPVNSPGSESFVGPGNETGKVKRKGCPKGKRRVVRKGRARCVKKRRPSRSSRQRKGNK
jgi:DNA-binding beta-propeller fold protein YncE